MVKATTKWLQEVEAGKATKEKVKHKVLDSKAAKRLRGHHGSEFQEQGFLQRVLLKAGAGIEDGPG